MSKLTEYQIDKSKDLMKLVEFTEIMRVTLAKLGAKYAKEPEKLAISTCYFMIDYNVFKKLNKLQNFLIELGSEDDAIKQKLDILFEDLQYWDTYRDFELANLAQLMQLEMGKK